MEVVEDTKKIIPEILDIRQSEDWANYLTKVGWGSYRTSRDVNIEILPTKLGGFVKLQRPVPLDISDLEEIEKICTDQKGLFIKIEPSFHQDIKVLTDNGYVPSYSPLLAPSTLYIDLSLDKDSLFSNISKSKRYSIRHNDLKVAFIHNPTEDQLKDFYSMALVSARRNKFSIQSYSLILEQLKSFKENFLLVLGYSTDGQLVGGKIVLIYKDTAWYVHAGTSEYGRSTDCGATLMWELILYLKSKNFRYLDLEGIDDPRFPIFTKNWEGFSFFKEQFGGIKAIFPYSYVKYLNPVLRFMSKVGKMPF